MRADKAKVVDEVWDDARIEDFLAKGTMGNASEDYSRLLHAYRSMRPDDFARFINRFKALGGDVNATDENGRTLFDVIKGHEKSGAFQEILRG